MKPKPKPADGAPETAPKKRRRKRLPWIMSKEECAHLKNTPNTRCPTGMRDRAMLEVMHRGGLRVSEVVNLRRRDIIWDQGLLEIRDAKGGKDRTVQIDGATVNWLRAWDALRPRGEWFFNRVKRARGLKAGGQISTRTVQIMFRRQVERAVLLGHIDADRGSRMTPHKLRHAHATELLHEGVSITEVQEQLGHEDLSTTNLYTHARPDGLKEFMANRAPDLPGPRE